jgi:predicted unusual protein kinase regulating ubiquinone biosynthesis (AarF/ABC1/UbiB family)
MKRKLFLHKYLALQVERTLEKNRPLANQLLETHAWLTKIAACLRYPPHSYLDQPISAQQVAQEMDQLLAGFQPDRHRQRPQSALCSRLQHLWRSYGEQLLPCYDIPGLPPDNLQLESFFNRVRRHQRRTSGRKSTRELNRFGHYLVLFTAESEVELLEHLRKVPIEVYQTHRQQLQKAEKPRQFLYRLHRNPEDTVHKLVSNHLNPPIVLLEGLCSV